MRRGSSKTNLTLRCSSEGSREVARLAVGSLSVFEHPEEESSLAEKTVLLRTRRREVGFGDGSEREGVVKSLEDRVGVGVGDVSFETRVASGVVESARRTAKEVSAQKHEERDRDATNPKSKSSTPTREEEPSQRGKSKRKGGDHATHRTCCT